MRVAACTRVCLIGKTTLTTLPHMQCNCDAYGLQVCWPAEVSDKTSANMIAQEQLSSEAACAKQPEPAET